MPRRRKDCPVCGKQALLKLSNHLADCHDRQPYLIRAKATPLDLETVLLDLYKLIKNTKKRSKWYK